MADRRDYPLTTFYSSRIIRLSALEVFCFVLVLLVVAVTIWMSQYGFDNIFALILVISAVLLTMASVFLALLALLHKRTLRRIENELLELKWPDGRRE